MSISTSLPRSLALALALGMTAMLLAHPLWGGRVWAYGLQSAAAAIVLATMACRRQLAFPSRLYLPVAALAGASALSLSAASAPDWEALLLPLSQLLMLSAGWQLAAQHNRHRTALYLLSAAAALAGAYGLLQFTALDPLEQATPFTDRIVSAFTNPNHFGNFAAAALPAGLGLYLHARGRPRLVTAIACILIYSGLLLSACRGAWWGGLAGCLVVCAGGAWRQWRALALLLLLCAAATAGLTHRPALQGPDGPVTLAQRLASSRHIVGEITGDRDAPTPDSTINHRYFLWARSWEMIRDHPLVGVGYGQFAEKFPAYRDRAADGRLFGSLRYHQKRENTAFAHNEYLHLWVETGLVGLLAFVWLVAAGTLPALKRAWNGPAEIWILLGILSVFLVHSLVSYPLRLPFNGTVFWLCLGALYRMGEDKR